MVAKDVKKQSDKIPHSNEGSIVAPVARFSNKLGKKDGGTEWKNCEPNKADVLSAIFDWNKFGCSYQRNKFVEASA